MLENSVFLEKKMKLTDNADPFEAKSVDKGPFARPFSWRDAIELATNEELECENAPRGRTCQWTLTDLRVAHVCK